MSNKCKEFILSNLDKVTSKDKVIKEYDRNIIYENFKTAEICKTPEEGAYIEIDKVVGTGHSDYCNKTWLEAFNSLKKDSNNLSSIHCEYSDDKKGLQYYNAPYNDKELWPKGGDPWGAYVYILNNDREVYLTSGNNRSIVARFLYELELIENKIPTTRDVFLVYVDVHAMTIFKQILVDFQKAIENERVIFRNEIQEIARESNNADYTLSLHVTFRPLNKEQYSMNYNYNEAYDKIASELSLGDSTDKIIDKLTRMIQVLKKKFSESIQ